MALVLILAGVGLLTALNIGVALGRFDQYLLGVMTMAAINVILTASLNLINGFTGQFSIGHAGFMAIGAYTAAMLSLFAHWPFWLVLLAGAAAAGAAGLLIGLPTLRLRGDYLAIATLGFGEIIRVVILNIPVTGGPRGLPGIPNLTNFFVAEGVMVVTLVFIYNLVNSSHGRAFLAVREDEIAAETMGINTTAYKVIAFSIGAGFAGLAGSLFAHHLMFINPASFSFMKSIEILVMLVLGGLGSLTGSVVAAVGLTFLPEYLRQFSDYRMVLYSALLIVMMLTRPQGLFGKKELTDLLHFEGRGGLGHSRDQKLD
ncbi:MAG: branched-chain amino acid ABC transporter permease [Firmicutes bacterium]|nr:branched-chain amino acid ABC transporter permease [Bacillota bacterium]